MSDKEFLEVIKKSFYKYLDTGSRSNEKLKILHGAIASDLHKRLKGKYDIYSLGFESGKEVKVKGRYMDKTIDITIKKGKEVICAIGVKFIMRNYSQNSNNYFENMLGETANIRTTGIPYFQIFVISSQIPYFKKEQKLDHLEIVTENNLNKYIKLSNDDINECMQTPDKTLLYIVDLPTYSLDKIKDFNDYIKFFKKNNKFEVVKYAKSYNFGDEMIYNDYDKFIKEIVNYIMRKEGK